MKVLVNSLAVPSCRQGGAGFYTSMLIDGLSRTDGIDCTALASRAVADELEELAPDAKVLTAFKRSRSPHRKVLNQLIAARRPWTLDLGFSNTAPRTDVVHWPIAFMNGPTSGHTAAWVLTIHDLQHEFFPEFFSHRDRLLRRLRWRPSAQTADHIVTISEFSRRMICERFDLPADKVTAIPLAARKTLVAEDRAGLPPPLKDGGAPWVVYPASPLPAKNHLRLLDALLLYRKRSGEHLRLVLIGPTMHSWRPIEEAIAKRGVEDSVIRLGHVREATLSAIYRNAAGLVFPSLFEGFGLPVLEAMAAGCAVATSTAGSLPELVGDVGHTFSPYDVGQIADALDWLARLNGEERNQQRTAGKKRAAHFSLERMTDETRAVYEGLS